MIVDAREAGRSCEEARGIPPDEATQRPPGLESFATLASDAVHAHQRAVEAAQGWSTSLLDTLQEQTRSYSAMLRSVDASLRAMEQAVRSQAETTKALTESLEASRQVVESATQTSQRSFEQVESWVEGLLSALDQQLGSLRAQVETGRALTDPVAAQGEAFLAMTQDWMDAYRRLAGAAPAAWRPRDQPSDGPREDT